MKTILVMTFLVSSGLIGCGSAQQTTSSNRVVIFGDSIAAGAYTDTNYGDYIAANTKRQVVNMSVAGSTLVYYQYNAMMSFKFLPGDIVLFTPGVNDVIQHYGDTAYFNMYTTELNLITEHVNTSGAKLVLGTTLKTLNYIPDNEIQFVGNIAKAQVGVVLFDGYSAFTPDSTNMLSDNLHPNDLGETQLGAAYVNFLNALN